MSEDTIIHVSITDASEEELSDIRDFMEDALSDYDGSGKIIVSTDRMELHELPALDDYTDEFADKVAERLKEES